MSGRTNVVPASLSYLTIYNPSLGGKNDEETLHDQILYYYSGTDKLRREDKPKAEGETDDNRKVMNERLRQIGLAQGMVEFAKYLILLIVETGSVLKIDIGALRRVMR